jgi:putative ABC transport system permease protein
MTTFARDVRYAGRRLRARPGLAAVIVGSLALGIAANTMVFSLVNGLLLGATPYHDPGRVLLVWFTPPNEPGARTAATHANCRAIREWAQRFEHLGCVLPASTTNIADPGPGGAAPERLVGQEFTAGVAEALGVTPVLGRWFSLEEEQRAEPVMVISYRLWQRRFQGAPDVIGKQVHATGQRLAANMATIIGVMPPGFTLLNGQADYWLPLAAPAAAATSPTRELLLVGRVRHGVTPAQVHAEANAMAARLEQALPWTNRGWGIFAEPVRQTLWSGFGTALLILQGAVACVLLIACANIAGLLLAEAGARGRELAVRSALGAGRWRMIRLLLTESLLLSLLGAALGVALAHAGLRVLVAWLPPGIPGVDAVIIDPSALGFTAALCLITALGFGIAPALHASRRTLADALKDSPGPSPAVGPRLRLRSALAAAQVALALVLSIGAGLMLTSLARLNAVRPGVETAGVMTFQVQLGSRDHMRETATRAPSGAPVMDIAPRLLYTAEQIRERLINLPGVLSASAVAATPPLSGFARSYTIEVPGRESAAGEGRAIPVQWFTVLADYFATLQAPLVRGREFTVADTAAAPAVAVINQTLAERLWPGGDPIGQAIQVRLFNEPRRSIVGVVADIRQSTRQHDALYQIYVPFAQLPPVQSGVAAQGLDLLTYAVRTSGDPVGLTRAFREVIADIDPLQPVFNVQPLEQYVSSQLGGFQQYVLLLAVFGATAVILAVIGIFGLMAQSVSQRAHEIGIHLALGAGEGDVLWLVLRRGIALTAIGLAIGVVSALGLTHLLQSYLWEVRATDPLTFLIVATAVGTVSVLSCYVAARPTLRVDPVIALRQGR